MLPHPDDGPSSGGKSRGHLTIPLGVPCQLRAPIARVDLRHRPVIRAAVPEASVDEDRHLGSCEGDVDVRSEPVKPNEEVLPEAQSQGVELASEPELSRGVDALVRSTDLARTRARRLRVWDDASAAERDVAGAVVRWLSHACARLWPGGQPLGLRRLWPVKLTGRMWSRVEGRA